MFVVTDFVIVMVFVPVVIVVNSTRATKFPLVQFRSTISLSCHEESENLTKWDLKLWYKLDEFPNLQVNYTVRGSIVSEALEMDRRKPFDENLVACVIQTGWAT
jgi:hypothetical protein